MANNLLESVGVRVPTPPPQSITSASKRVGSGFNGRSGVSKPVLSRSYSHFDQSAVPLRFMYFHNETWCNFSNDVVQVLRTGFLERKPIIEASIDGAKYTFDLKRMVQIEYSTGNCRSISWVDECSKCFFPSCFFSEEEFAQSDSGDSDDNISCNYKTKNNNCNPKIEIEVKIDPTFQKRKREEAEVSSSYKVPTVGNAPVKVAALFPKTKRLMETERDYYLIKNHFIKGIMRIDPHVTVTSIHQCTWEWQIEKTRLHVFQKQNEIIRAARGTSNVVYAWFGASANLVERILVHGFGLPCKLPVTAAYGVGVYLTPVGLPHVSANLADADDNGVKHLILCRVILGNVEKVEAGSKQYLPSSVNFDTGSDDPKNPKWYVVWPHIASIHILPESVVSFKYSVFMQGQPKPLLRVGYSLEKLFLKIKNTLPPVKVQEIKLTYLTFKAQLIPKDAFIRRLREVAGDEVLRSAILEINASQ